MISIIKVEEIPEEIVEIIGKPVRYHYPRQGQTSHVVVVTTHLGQFVLKMSDKPLYMQWLAKEYQHLQCLQETSIPVPQVHHFIKTVRGNWLVLDYLDGISLRVFLSQVTDSSRRDQAITSYGEILRCIHQSAIPENLMISENWLDRMLIDARYNLNHYDVDGTEALLTKLEEHRPAPIAPTLIHGDFTIDNVIISNNKVIGVIDWSGAACGDPRYDISLAIRPKKGAFDNDRDRMLFYDGYQLRTVSEFEFEYFDDGLYSFF